MVFFVFLIKNNFFIGPGEMGNAVFLTGKEAVQGTADMKKWFMNVAARFFFNL